MKAAYLTPPSNWSRGCALADIYPDSGVCVDLADKQIAVFRVDDCVYAIDNFDPASKVNVLSRGIVGDIGGELVVASPIYKQHFSLATGRCLEDPELSVSTYPVRLLDGLVWLRAEPMRPQRPGKRRLVVVGNGMAGMRTVEELLKIAPQTYQIEVFGAEPHGNYDRMLLSPVLSGEKKVHDIMLHPLEWYRKHGVTLHTADPVIDIDRVRRRVKSRSGAQASYDRLLLATGSSPMVLPVRGSRLAGVRTFRDLHDVDTLLAVAREGGSAVVIGGGLLGLEAANGLRCRGMDVTVVHLPPTLMERQLDPTAAQLLRLSLEKRGLKFKLPARTVAILGESRVTGVQFEDGSEISADLVVMAVGIRPNADLAQAAGIQCDRGVLVDDTMLTYDPSIYAVGECVQHRNQTYGLVAPLWEQAAVCARQLAEVGVIHYKGSLYSTRLKVTGIDLFSAGDFSATTRSESLVFNDAKRGIYKRLVIENDQIRGVVLYGDTRDGPWYFELMNQARNIAPLRHRLLFGEATSNT
jgi:NAD(P)H-dependent nitrite reductase large subunit/NAD(P)H-dependent nitrite reductase small subunit